MAGSNASNDDALNFFLREGYVCCFPTFSKEYGLLYVMILSRSLLTETQHIPMNFSTLPFSWIFQVAYSKATSMMNLFQAIPYTTHITQVFACQNFVIGVMKNNLINFKGHIKQNLCTT
jgi:hypothetical protein